MIPHIFGFSGVLCLALSFQVNTKQKIMIMQCLGRVLFIVQYILLFAPSGAVQNGICMVCAWVFKNNDLRTRKFRITFYAILLLSALCTFLWWESWISGAVLIGAILQNAAFAMKTPRKVRLFTLAGLPFWFTYNLLSHSFAGMVSDFMCLCSLLSGIVRFDILKQKENVQ